MNPEIECKIYKIMTKLVSEGKLAHVPVEVDIENRPKKVVSAEMRIVNAVNKKLKNNEHQYFYLITTEISSYICKELNISKLVLSRALRQNSYAFHSHDLKYKKLYAIRLLDLDNDYISTCLTFEDRNIELIYDRVSGYVNVTRFSSQFESAFSVWRREFNGNEAIKWLNEKYNVKSRMTSVVDEETNYKIIYKVDDSVYDFGNGDYIHPEIFQMYASFVHPVLGLLVSRLFPSLKVSRTSYLRCKYEQKVKSVKRRMPSESKSDSEVDCEASTLAFGEQLACLEQRRSEDKAVREVKRKCNNKSDKTKRSPEGYMDVEEIRGILERPSGSEESSQDVSMSENAQSSQIIDSAGKENGEANSSSISIEFNMNESTSNKNDISLTEHLNDKLVITDREPSEGSSLLNISNTTRDEKQRKKVARGKGVKYIDDDEEASQVLEKENKTANECKKRGTEPLPLQSRESQTIIPGPKGGKKKALF